MLKKSSLNKLKAFKAFTLIEMAIVVMIIGLILGFVASRSSSLIGNSETTDTIALIKDLNDAASSFKNKYHYLPGDLPLAGDDIPNVSAGCSLAVNTASIGNGRIDTATEVGCVAEHLVRAGMIKGTINGIFTRSNNSNVADVFITARRAAGSLPVSVINEIQINNLSCDTVRTIDSKLDDGDITAGRITASVAACVPNGANDPVPILDIAI
ncbi:MAG: prepilin-type N-terminal cleavage/methylation domain-containing protein [Methylotenera sp.]|nr:prepilin-type N-terminal cleavage/methylation domain-containing protein [Methylotenera sp.]MDP3607493.1 prepilin-type N-terminal cleavage/methylation domain-containing protein [Methylophilus sp.]